MTVLGLESSCDECAAAIVRNGKEILSNTIVSQLKEHQRYAGVVPELASRLHCEWVMEVTQQALKEAQVDLQEIDAIAVTQKPGLIGSLTVGLSFAKTLALGLRKPFLATDHILAHIYAAQLEKKVSYPHLSLLVSGGHTFIAVSHDYDQLEVLGSTIDDACGEAFDKVAKHYKLGYPGGPAIDKLARQGDPCAYEFPKVRLKRQAWHRQFDLSYSGLKTAAIWQSEQFSRKSQPSLADLAASFQCRAIHILLERLDAVVKQTKIKRLVIGGGVACNSYLRQQLEERKHLEVFLPSLKLCIDNGAMVAGLAYNYLMKNISHELSVEAYSRTHAFRSLKQQQSA